MLTEKKMWALIDGAKWTSDHDYERISLEFVKTLSAIDCMQLFEFIHDKIQEMATRFHNDWLGNPGIGVSDDGWSDLRAEVVGRGKKFFDGITVKKLQDMAKHRDYHENFGYCTDEEVLVTKADVKDLPLLLERVTGSVKELLVKRLKGG
jgi:hypothetical protein